jgi:hypothetical protein
VERAARGGDDAQRQCRPVLAGSAGEHGSAAETGPALPVEHELDEHDELQRKLAQEIVDLRRNRWN